MIRTYIEWLVAVPWSERSDERLDPDHAREVFDADHAAWRTSRTASPSTSQCAELRAEREITKTRSRVRS